MGKEACPCCTDNYVRKLHTNAVLDADEEQVEKLKAQRMVAWENLPPSTRSAKAPRAGKKRVQEYFCICFQQRNSCKCAVGPFNDHALPLILSELIHDIIFEKINICDSGCPSISAQMVPDSRKFSGTQFIFSKIRIPRFNCHNKCDLEFPSAIVANLSNSTVLDCMPIVLIGI